jgi:hypothetical protein
MGKSSEKASIAASPLDGASGDGDPKRYP